MPSAPPFLQHGRDDRPELAPRRRIDADRRLVEQQQPRPRSSAQAKPSFCFMPPESCPASRCGERRQAGETQQPREAFGAHGCGHRRAGRRTGRGSPPRSDPRTGRSAAACSRSPDAPPRRRSPCRGQARRRARSGRSRPAISRSSVVLPAPSGPTRPVITPGWIVAEKVRPAQMRTRKHMPHGIDDDDRFGHRGIGKPDRHRHSLTDGRVRVLDADAQPIDKLRAQLRCLYRLRSELGGRRHIADAAAIRPARCRRWRARPRSRASSAAAAARERRRAPRLHRPAPSNRYWPPAAPRCRARSPGS